MNLKPTKWKVIVSVVAVILVFLIIPNPKSMVGTFIGSESCIGDFIGKPLAFYGSCNHWQTNEKITSFNINFLIIDIIIYVFIFSIVYVIWSLIDKKKF